MAENQKSRGVSMKLQDIQKLISMLENSGVNELEMETEGMKLKLSKGTQAGSPASPSPQFVMMSPQASAPPAYFPPAAPQPPSPPQAATGEAVGGAAPAPAPARAASLVEIKSPMVGTFYRAPAPGAEPFVKVGDRVRKGQTLCIIEAMKLMNEIESEADGTVVDILTENAQPVEYGEPLILVEPQG
jgi:acetyl-CoA carboxylase biotin carboxyl carrier protein